MFSNVAQKDSPMLSNAVILRSATPVDRVTRECEIINRQGLRVLPRVLPVPTLPFSSYAGLVSRAPMRRTRKAEGVDSSGDSSE
jgi:hypothetical protein